MQERIGRPMETIESEKARFYTILPNRIARVRLGSHREPMEAITRRKLVIRDLECI